MRSVNTKLALWWLSGMKIRITTIAATPTTCQ